MDNQYNKSMNTLGSVTKSCITGMQQQYEKNPKGHGKKAATQRETKQRNALLKMISRKDPMSPITIIVADWQC